VTWWARQMNRSGPPEPSPRRNSGGSAAADAANYPCPPPVAGIEAGDSCVIVVNRLPGGTRWLYQSLRFQRLTFAHGLSHATTPRFL
jgi:hypothetical protein